MTVIYRVGDLVFDDDLGVGIVTRIMQDGYEDNDGYYDGLVYLVWWSRLGETAIEYSFELTPYWSIESKGEDK